MSLERAAIALVPVAALTAVGVGLKLAEPPRVVATRVYASSPPAGRSGFSLQLVTSLEDSGVESPAVESMLSVRAYGHGQVRWEGTSTADGVAETWIDLPKLAAGDHIDLSVRGKPDGQLAIGRIVVPSAPPRGDLPEPLLPGRHSPGDLTLDVIVYGGVLVPGFPSKAFVRVRDGSGKPVEGVSVAAQPEPGLVLVRPFQPTGAGGWTSALVRADFLTAAWTLSATSTDPSHGGTWAGALPVAPGASTMDLPPSVPSGAQLPLVLTVPDASPRLYADVRDAEGRVFAEALAVPRAQHGQAHLTVPALLPGDYWLVTSADLRGVETLTGATIARPFRVEPTPPADPDATLLELVQKATPPTPRVLVLDGFNAFHQRAEAARRRGLKVGLIALGLGALAEVLLLVRAARVARREMQRMEAHAEGAGLAPPETASEGRRVALRVVLLILVTIFGFAVAAFLLLQHSAG